MITVKDLKEFLKDKNDDVPVYYVFEHRPRQKVIIEIFPLEKGKYSTGKGTVEEFLAVMVPSEYE